MRQKEYEYLMLKFQPRLNRVLILPDKTDNITESGLYIVKANEEKPITGTVVVGNDSLKEGDRVLFSKFGYDEVTIDKQVHYVVSDTTILGIFT